MRMNSSGCRTGRAGRSDFLASRKDAKAQGREETAENAKKSGISGNKKAGRAFSENVSHEGRQEKF
jgi:hypothetical protein